MVPETELTSQTSTRRAKLHQRSNLTAHKPEPWKLKDINWSFVFGAQHYGTLVLTLFPTAALAIVVFGVQEKPVNDELSNIINMSLYDWKKRDGSVPSTAAVLVPLIYYLMILLVVELHMFKLYHKHITNAVHAIVYFIIGLFCAFVIHIFTHQISAIVVAEPRPDFKTRCNPQRFPGDGENPVCQGNVSDAYSSFFSGHASSSMVIAAYSTVYLLWSMYFRADAFRKEVHMRMRLSMEQSNDRARTINRVSQELVHGAVMYLIILQVGYSWIVGISRVIDNRNFIWDVNSGFLVGAIVGILFGFQTIGIYGLVPAYKPTNLNSIAESTT